MNLEVFLILLMAASILTSLFTESVKVILAERKKKYYSNTIAGAVAVVVSVLLGAAYTVITGTAFNDKLAVYLIALVLMSWLSAMVGYDKVVQAISQIRGQ